jgi:hypothetical protein
MLTSLDIDHFQDLIDKQPGESYSALLNALHCCLIVTVIWIERKDVVEIADVEHLQCCCSTCGDDAVLVALLSTAEI